MNIIDISVNFVYNNTKGDFVWLDINTARIPKEGNGYLLRHRDPR